MLINYAILIVVSRTMSRSVARKKHALVLDGRSLSNILGELEDPELKNLLSDVIHGVVTVLCCRMTPLQKALVRTGIE